MSIVVSPERPNITTELTLAGAAGLTGGPHMYAENHHYGHAEIVLTHCGLPPDGRIPVRMQHGWQPGIGMRERDMEQPGPKAVWSRRNLERAQEAGYADVVPMGAPFVYLPDAPDDGPSAGERSLLVVPFHGWEKEALASSMEGYAQALDALVAEGWGPVTVCLYWFEYEQPDLRGVFEAHGFATTTLGRRDDNPRFLFKQRELVRAHGAVTSNRVATATFYALHAGRPFFLYGPCVGLSGTDDATGEVFDAWQRAEFPELCFDAFEAAGRPCHKALGDAELGLEFKLEPAALRAALLLGKEHASARARLRLRRAGANVARALNPRR